jgi:hypothetical protein
MTPAEILNEISKLPIAEQKALRKKLFNEINKLSIAKQENLRKILFSNLEYENESLTQDVFDRILFKEGFLSNLPGETVEDDDFEPVEFTGKPISETIIEERR